MPLKSIKMYDKKNQIIYNYNLYGTFKLFP